MDPVIYMAIGFSGVAVAVMIYKSIPYIKFAYPTAKAETVGNPFITEKALNQVIESKNLTSFKNIVNSYKDYNVEGEKIGDVHKSLDNILFQSIDVLRRESPKELNEFYERFVEFLDAHNLKNFIKAKMIGKDIEVRFFSRKFKRWADYTSKLEYEETLAFLKEKELDISAGADPFEIDLQVDRYVIRGLSESKVPRVAKDVKREFVERLLDIANLRNIIRAKMNQLDAEKCKALFVMEGREIPRWKFDELCMAKELDEVISGLQGTSYHELLKEGYESSKRYNNDQLVELSLDKILLKVVQDMSMKNFPFFGPLLKFIVSKYYEIRNLKVISKGVDEGLPKERIKPLLVVGG